jgi:hypothetical protein
VVLVLAAGHRLALAVEQGQVRAIELVEAEEVEIDVPVLDVDPGMGGIGDAVDADHGAGLMGLGGDLGHRVDAADHVGAVGKADQAAARAQEIVERRQVELAAFRVDAPLLYDQAVIGQPPPGAAVGLVVLLGDDDLVARLKAAAQCLGQDKIIQGRRGPDDDFLRCCADHLRHPAFRRLQQSRCHARGLVGPIGLVLTALHEGGQALDHRQGHIGPAGVFEVSHAIADRREKGPAEFQVEGDVLSQFSLAIFC